MVLAQRGLCKQNRTPSLVVAQLDSGCSYRTMDLSCKCWPQVIWIALVAAAWTYSSSLEVPMPKVCLKLAVAHASGHIEIQR